MAPFAGAAVAAALCIAFSVRGELALGRGGRFDVARARRYAAYGLPVSLSLLLAVVISGTDRILLAVFLDEAAVGAYHAGYNLANRTLDIIFVWLGLAGGPAVIAAFERGGGEDLKKAARQQADVMVLLGLPAAVGLALVAQPLAELLVGEALRDDAARAVPWIAAAGFFGGVTIYLDNAFTLSRRSGLLFVVMAIPAIANVGLNLLLIPLFGFDGALVATTASLVLGAVASYVLGLRAQPMPIPLTTLARCGLAAAVMTIVLLLLPSLDALPELVLKAAVGALVYGAAALLLDAGGLRSGGLARLLRLRPPMWTKAPERT